ncbi:MAG: hypothetical protein OJF52_001490 [Nitrospira sp.]|nr:MAG: hypothetical protein OJF52_001490 [Nitrospira sp.]
MTLRIGNLQPPWTPNMVAPMRCSRCSAWSMSRKDASHHTFNRPLVCSAHSTEAVPCIIRMTYSGKRCSFGWVPIHRSRSPFILYILSALPSSPHHGLHTLCRTASLNRAAMEPVTRDHNTRALALTHRRHGHRADRLQGLMIKRAAVASHRESKSRTFRDCYLY